jgi:hypothetical protein
MSLHWLLWPLPWNSSNIQPRGPKTPQPSLCKQNTTAIILQADWSNLNFLDHWGLGCCQSVLAHFVSGSDGEPTSHIHWQCVWEKHDHEWRIVRRSKHYKFFAACGLPIVLAKPITHKPCGSLTPEYLCLLSRATDPHHAPAHSVTLLLS